MANSKAVFDISTLKHVLFLENEFWREDQLINNLYNWFVENDIECTIIDRASHRKDEIVELLPTIDCIAFQSTFLYEDEVKGVGDLLKKMPKPLTVFGLPTGDQGLEYFLERIWEVEELAKMSHHNVYELEHVFFDKSDDIAADYQWCRKVDMLAYKTEWERLEHERVTKNKNMPKTGNKVLIKQLQACGGQWANLKEGDIVDELNCSSIDENPARGIWVMGVDESVKLLNSDGYEEWEFHEPNYLALTKEFFARGDRANAATNKYRGLFAAMAGWIRNCSSELQTSDAQLWDWCDQICTSVGVERRGNRRYFERRLKEYRKRFHYFKEDA